MAYVNLSRNTIIKKLAANPSYPSAEAAVKALGRKTNVEEIALALVDEQLLFCDDAGTYTPRSLFFKGASVLISLTEMEIKRGILVPGHRFLPLYDLTLPPAALRIEAEGKTVRRVPVGLRLEELQIFFTLFGNQHLFPLLLHEDERNGEIITQAESYNDAIFTLSALDMTDLYKTWNLQPGDTLIARCDDWAKGILTISPASGKDGKPYTPSLTPHVWTSKLEKAFVQLWNKRGWPLSPDEEFARAFHRAGRELLSAPPIHLGGFLERCRRITFFDLQFRSFLWDRDRGMDEKATAMAGRVYGHLAESKLEDLLERLQIMIPLPFITACVKETITAGAQYDSFIGSVFSGNDISHLRDNELSGLVLEMAKLYKEQLKNFDPRQEQPELAQLRNRTVQHYSALAESLLQMEEWIDPEDSEFQRLLEVFASRVISIIPIFELLNGASDSRENISEENLDQVSSMLSAIVQECSQIMEEISAKFKNEELEARKIERKYAAPSLHYYQLEVSLDGISPPIRRLLQIPENMNLKDLHHVIQAAFGWQDMHLHEFFIDGTHYATSDEEEDTEDEELFRIADLGEKKAFRYLYDFGDSWQHTIKVVRKIEASRVGPLQKEIALCLEGNRSAPPEDCGGIGGFEELLMTLATPETWRSDDQNSTVAWLGEWEADAFDIEAVNRELGRI
jgi:hypothetical protein